MNDEDDELAAAAEELADTLEELSRELRGSRRGALGLPRLPSPSAVFTFTESYAIPTLIAILEANIRVLELLAEAIRVADGRPLDGGGRAEIERVSRSTLRKLDGALSDLQTAIEGGEPSNPDVSRLLEDARSLREEIDRRLATASEDGSRPETPADRSLEEFEADENGRDESTTTAGSEPEAVDIDVESELESIKEDVSASEDRSTDTSYGESGGDTTRDGDSGKADEGDEGDTRDVGDTEDEGNTEDESLDGDIGTYSDTGDDER